MGNDHSITVEDIKHMCNAKNSDKKRELAKKIFDQLDTDHSGFLDHKETMAIIEAEFKTMPDHIRKQVLEHINEEEYK